MGSVGEVQLKCWVAFLSFVIIRWGYRTPVFQKVFKRAGIVLPTASVGYIPAGRGGDSAPSDNLRWWRREGVMCVCEVLF